MNKFVTMVLCVLLITISGCVKEQPDHHVDKEQLLELEKQWFENEFLPDTAFLASIMDSTFICITEGGVMNKAENLKNIHKNSVFRLKNDIVIDSFRLENVVVNIYANSAVVSFTDHTYARKQGNPIESRIQFYDVWIKRGDKWKAVASQAHY